MDQLPSGSPANQSGANGLVFLEKLERRVLALVEELREARAARRQAETEAVGLRQLVLERDSRIALLQKNLDCDEVRRAARERVQALLRRVEELEREG